jgi:hypothetical protein
MAFGIDVTSEGADDDTKLMWGQETADFGGFFGRLADSSVTHMGQGRAGSDGWVRNWMQRVAARREVMKSMIHAEIDREVGA